MVALRAFRLDRNGFESQNSNKQYRPARINGDEYVHDYLTTHGWNLENLRSVILANCVSEIYALFANSSRDKNDSFYWKHNKNDKFSVRSAYDILANTSDHRDHEWNLIWNLKIPPKIAHFVWTLFHGKILTNNHQANKRLISDDIFPLCYSGKEDLNHAFCYCPKVDAVWNSLTSALAHFRTDPTNFKRWIKMNLSNHTQSFEDIPWSTIFACTLWYFWKWRCKSAFNPQWNYPNNVVSAISYALQSWSLVNLKNSLKPSVSMI